jgi:septal ring factor EnvC (AmiA/AmiB activator)
VGAHITGQKAFAGGKPELVPPPLALGASRRANSRGDRVRRSRRRAQRHTVVASALAVLALVGCVAAILMLATLPTAARLQGEVASLNSRLDAAHTQLAKLQAGIARTDSQGSGVGHEVTRLSSRVAGLQATVHGLQDSTTLTGEQAAGLRACLPQVQQELAGLTLKTISSAGRLINVGLSVPALLSPSCEVLFSGT